MFPAINKYNRESNSGRDFLGQQSIIQTFADEGLPSFTNTTRKAKYYIFWAWAFAMLKKKNAEKPFTTDDGWWWYLQKLETAFIVVNKYNNPNITGLPGSTGIPYNLDEITKFKDNDDILIYQKKPRATGYSAVQYSPSLKTLGIVELNGINYILHKYGATLAELLDSKLRNIKGYDELVDAKTKYIKWKYLLNMTEALSVESIPIDEKKELLKIIEQTNNVDLQYNNQTPRTNTTLMILDALDKLTVSTPPDIMLMLWENKYKPATELVDITSGWKIVEARRYYQYSIETILASFCNYIRTTTPNKCTFRDFSSVVIKKMKKFKYVGLDLSVVFDNKSLIFGEFYEEIIKHSTKKKVTEAKIAQIIRDAYVKDQFDPEMVIYSITLLIVLIEKYDSFNTSNSVKVNKMLMKVFGYKSSFAEIKSKIEHYKILSIDQAIYNIIAELSLKLHLAVSQDKWMITGNFTYRFVQNDDGGYKCVHNMTPTMTTNKIGAFVYILRDVGLCKITEDEVTITAKGKEYLAKYSMN